MFCYSGQPVGLCVGGYNLYTEVYRNRVHEKTFTRRGLRYTDVDELYVLPDNKFYVLRAFNNFAFVQYVPNYVPRHVAIYNNRVRTSHTSSAVYAHTEYKYSGFDVNFSK